MKRLSYILMAFALLLGLAQCKKDQPQNPEGEKVYITVKVNDGASTGSATDGAKGVDPSTGEVSFENGDKLYVGYNGAQVGLLTYDGSAFSGEITISKDGEQPLYFYYLDGQELASGKVDISDQSSGCPVISMGASDRNYDAAGSYSTTLLNQCGLVEFTTAATTSPVHVGGMYTEVTIDHSSHAISHTATKGFVTLKTESTTSHWAVLLLQTGVANAGAAIGHVGYTVDVPEITANAYIHSGDAVAISTASHVVYLDWLTSNYEAQNGETLTGTLAGNFKISIADGATVTLDGVTINGVNENSYNWAGITCLGDATIILSGTNTLKGFYEDYPGIYVPQNKTVTIQDSGSLTASSNGYGCGIGGGYKIAGGNIVIAGGTITATGGQNGAGIGSGQQTSCGTITITGGTVNATGGQNGAGIGSGIESSCGDITISGGTVTATGGQHAGGIGSGCYSSCGGITIESTVTSVTTTKGSDAPNSIGAGYGGTCGTVTIGGVTVNPNSASAGTYGLLTLAISTTTNTDDTWTLTPTPAPSYDETVSIHDYNVIVPAGEHWLITGTTDDYHIIIEDGATVTLDGVDIYSYDNYCIHCEGSATVILKDGSTNRLVSMSHYYPALWIGGEGTTLTIQGSTGTLTVTSSNDCAGIGGGWMNDNHTCGNIVIEGGVIDAQGGSNAAGIGSDTGSACGYITISGGTVTATGMDKAAGIGSGEGGSCGNITITDGVTKVVATKGSYYVDYSIGAGNSGTCGTVTIDDVADAIPSSTFTHFTSVLSGDDNVTWTLTHK